MGYVKSLSQFLGSLFQMDALKAQDYALPLFLFFPPLCLFIILFIVFVY